MADPVTKYTRLPNPEQARMELFYRQMLRGRGVTVGWGIDKNGNYESEYARDAWTAWQAAQAMVRNG
jgi:hypothetical protein